MVHDTTKSRSLLSLLKEKDNIKFYDTALDYNPNNLIAYFGLCMLKMEKQQGSIVSGCYVPRLDFNLNTKKANFKNWWESIVIKDSKGKTFSRKMLVLAVSNKDGGAHVDPELDMDYAALSKFNSGGWVAYSGDMLNPSTVNPFKNGPELPSIRQISYEILKTLKDIHPMLFL